MIVIAVGALIVVTIWQPRFAMRLIARLNPRVLFFVDTEQPLVAITIDDGPHTSGTPRILDVLAENDAHATFFVIGEQIANNEENVRRVVREGHELGNHHMVDFPSIRLSPEEFEQQLVRTHKLLAPYAPVRWFRPASGWFNQRMLDQIERHGYTCVLGSAYLEDLIPSVSYLSRHILLNTRPGSIIVLHDGLGRSAQTAAVLGRVLPELRRRGYRVVTVSELVASKSARPGAAGSAAR